MININYYSMSDDFHISLAISVSWEWEFREKNTWMPEQLEKYKDWMIHVWKTTCCIILAENRATGPYRISGLTWQKANNLMNPQKEPIFMIFSVPTGVLSMKYSMFLIT